MSESEGSSLPRKKRETPWSVFIVAGIFFAIGLWLYLDVRREVKEAEAAKARAPVVSSAKPKILGLDIIPQLAESNDARVRAAPGASAGASAAPGGSASPGATTSAAASTAPLATTSPSASASPAASASR